MGLHGVSLARCSSKQNSCAGLCHLKGKSAFLFTHSASILFFFLSHHENGKQTFVKEFDTLFPCHVLILTSESCMQYAPQGLSLRTAVFFDHALLGLWEKNKQTNKKTPDVCLQLPVHNFCP